MADTITRIYATSEQAAKVVAALDEVGFPPEAINMVTPAVAEAGEEAVVGAIARGAVLLFWAKRLAPQVMEGGTLVSVRAPFGSGLTAEQVMDAHHPIATGNPTQDNPLTPWDESAPASSMLHMATLAKDPTPFATFWNLPTLSERRFMIGEPTLSRAKMVPLPTSTGSAFTLGNPKLLNDPAPLSSRLSLRLLGGPRSGVG